MMIEKVVIVRINNLEKYNKSFVKEYGILQRIMDETAVVNFSSNKGGLCVNISHGDYSILPENKWFVQNGKVIVSRGYDGYLVHTDLEIW